MTVLFVFTIKFCAIIQHIFVSNVSIYSSGYFNLNFKTVIIIIVSCRSDIERVGWLETHLIVCDSLTIYYLGNSAHTPAVQNMSQEETSLHNFIKN